MAQLAFSVVGALATTALGIGPQAGWAIGGAVAGLAFRRGGPDVEGPRLSDTLVTSSAEGAPIPIGFGTLRLGGNIIWSGGIVEDRQTESAGKGGGGQSVTSYSYTSSFAVAFAEGPAARVLRIWGDGKLIYDRTGASPEPAIEGLKFRFHRGNETQLPDPLIEAAEGEGMAPAHRGLCYIVFEDLPLAEFGNRIPNLTAEIAFRDLADLAADDLDLITTGEGGLFAGFETDELAVDWERQRGWLVEHATTTANSGLRRFDLRSMVETRQASYEDILASLEVSLTSNRLSHLTVAPDGALIASLGVNNRNPIVRIDAEAMQETHRFGFISASLGNSTTNFGTQVAFHVLPVFGIAGRVDYLIVGGDTINATGNAPVGVLTAADLSYIWGAGELVLRGVSGIVTREIGAGRSSAWIVVAPTALTDPDSAIRLYRIEVESGGGVLLTLADSVAASAISSGATEIGDVTGFVARDEIDGGIIFVTSTNAAGTPVRAVKWREGDGVVWATTLSVTLPAVFPGFAASRVRGGVFAARFGATVIRLDTATGAILDSVTWPGTVSDPQIFDSVSESIVHRASGTVRRIYLDRAAGDGDTAGQIVAALAERAGLTTGDLDVSALTDAVAGYVVARQGPARAAIEPILQLVFADAVESDDVLKFVKRGGAPAAALDEELLIAEGEGRRLWVERRAQEPELPVSVSVVFMDRNHGYRQGAQTVRRASAPAATQESREAITAEMPVAMTPREAKRLAERLLYSAWASRSTYEALLPRDYARLEPGDVITLALASGASFRARIVGMDLGADWTLALRAVSEEAASYTSEAEAGETEGHEETLVPGPAATRLFLPNVTLLRDEDSAPAGSARVYFAAGGFAEGWPGATLFRGLDLVEWERVALLKTGASWGVTTAALAAPRSVWALDDANALDFALAAGTEPASVTQAQLLAGANAALLIDAAGDAEILQFRDAEEIGPSRWRLTNLLRGRRGTDTRAVARPAGETILLLGAGAVAGGLLPASRIGTALYWRAVGVGRGFDSADTESRVFRGDDLKPYAPVHVTAALDGSDIDLAWVRRTRLNGGLRDGTGTVPLHEASESWAVDVLDGPGGAVLRTLTATGPAVTYTAAQIAADFGSTPSALSVVVHQISAEAGRGFGRAVTLEIA